jgi:hypothetical protein
MYKLVLLKELNPVLQPSSVFRTPVVALLHLEEEVGAATEALFQGRHGGGFELVHLILPSRTHHILPCILAHPS